MCLCVLLPRARLSGPIQYMSSVTSFCYPNKYERRATESPCLSGLVQILILQTCAKAHTTIYTELRYDLSSTDICVFSYALK